MRRLIRKPKNPMGKNWERIPQPMRSHNLWGLKVIKVDSSRAEMNTLQLTKPYIPNNNTVN